MRLKVVFNFSDRIFLPWNYLDYLKGMFYEVMMRGDPEVARFAHEEGFQSEGKRYKLFTFSLLYPRHRERRSDGLIMWGEVNWFFSSPIPGIVEAFAAGMLMEGQVELGKARCDLARVEVMPAPEFSEEMNFRTLSPIVASTGRRSGDKFGKVFLNPDDPDFRRVLTENLVRKYKALFGEEPEGEVEIEPCEPYKSKLFNVSGTNVRGYEMRLKLKGDPILIKLAYEAGLGERNGQGFGMIAIDSRRLKPRLQAQDGV